MPRGQTSAATSAFVVVSCAVLATVRVAAATPFDVSDADKRTMAGIGLQWAVDGGIADFKLVKDPATLIVSTANLPARTALKLPGRKVLVLPPSDIQALADKDGDFLYFRFGSFTGDSHKAQVSLSLVWAVSKRSQQLYLSGGGATLHFEKHDGKWQLQPVTDRWMS